MRVLRQSEVNLFLRCGKAWEFRYVKGLVVPPTAALTVGTAVDRAITVNMEQKIKTETDLPIGDVLDACSTEFEKEAPETDWRDSSKEEEKDKAIKCVGVYHEQLAPKISPQTVQQTFTIPTDSGFDISGTMDLTTKNGWVRDSKTAARAGMYSLTGNIQAGIYDLAYQSINHKRAKGFAFDVMIKTKAPKTEIVGGEVTDQHRVFVSETLKKVNEAMNAGIALPASEQAYWCSPGYCGFWSMCKGKK
jgi:hypothetical protein